MILLSTHCPWLNPAGMFLRRFRREVTHCGLFDGMKALIAVIIAAILDFVKRSKVRLRWILSVIDSNPALFG